MASNHRQGVGNLHQQKAGILIAILATVIAALASAAPSADAPDDDVALAVTSITETSTADFAGGSLAGAMVAETDNGAAGGQLRLAAPLGDLFLAATLDSLWHITYPTSGFTPVIEDGVLDVQERNDANYQASGLETWATFENGVVCEVRAMFLPGSAFVNLGFTSTTTSVGQWMFFSTRGTGNQQVPVIKTSLRSAAGSSVDVPTSTTFGEWHVFRIVWVGSTVTYYVDDVMVDQRTNVSITLPQRVAFYKTGGSDSPFFVDWVRVTPYTTSSAAYESRVLDAGTPASPWTALDWAGSTPDTTTVTFETRTGETAVPDTTWSAWSAPAGDDVTSPAGRYLQYRAVMSSTDPAVSPVIDEVSVAYTYPDVTAPTVTGTTPPDGATDVVVGASILAGFDEPIDPATLTAESFTLAPTGGSALPATVSYDSIGDVAILTPAAPLAYATTYEARVTTAVTDLEANPLAADHVWTFTTAAQDTIPLAVVSTVPAAGATNILARRLVTATFSEAVDPATLTATSFTVAPLGGLPVDATVSYDPAGFRAILDSTVDLDWATTYEVRLSTAVTDLSGNPLAQDEVWTFTTRLDAPVTITATTDTDFAAGELGGLAISEVDSSAAAGQLRLDSRLYDSFREPTLDPQWHATNPDGYAPIIENGVLDVQERDGETFDLSSIESYQTWGPGVVLEARAMFVPGSRFIDVGFDGSTINNNQYAWFSTAGTGDQPGNERIYARYREWDHNTIALETTATFNEWHVFKIIWAHGQLQYFVDGVLEAEASNVLITTPMRAAFYKSAYSDTPFYIDWIRVTPYTESIGTYKSPIFDAGEPDANWIDLDWSGSTPAATGIAFTTRSGDTLPPDETWSGWSPVDGGDITSPPGRYVQYRADLTTSDDLVSPVIDEIHLSRDPVPDMTAPAVIATAPADSATGVPLDIVVTATFSEPLDAATVTVETFTLTPEGGEAIVAMVAVDSTSTVATLTPQALLSNATLYEARLTTAIADTAANSLETDHVWTFTTAPLDTVAPAVIATAPADSATGVPVDVVVTATFSEPLDAATVTVETFTLTPEGGEAILATVAMDSTSTVATLTPQALLLGATLYEARLTAAIADTAANNLASDHVWTFTTATLDTVAPAVIATAPADSATGVPLDAVVTAIFSEPLDAATVTVETFTLTPEGGEAILATVAMDSTSTVATLTPQAQLSSATLYEARLTTAIADTAANSLVADHVWAFTTATLDTVAPAVIATAPADSATGVPLNAVVTATFSEPLDAATVTVETFTLTPEGGEAIVAMVAVDSTSTVATLTPQALLLGATLYEARLTTAITDTAANSLASDHVWTFTTVAADTVAPAVIATAPADSATGVPLDAVVTAIFSEPLDAATVTVETFTLTPEGGEAILATVAMDSTSTVATLTPQAQLSSATLYEARLTTAIADTAANSLVADHVWAFTTATLDTVAPAVIATAPADSATGVPLDAVVTATFSEPLDAATVTVETFTLTPEGGEAIVAMVAVDSTSTVATLTPQAQLSSATLYEARLTTVIADTAGNPLVTEVVWSFTTRLIDAAAPTVTATIPVASAVGIPVGVVVTATFSEPLDAATVTVETFTLTPEGGEAIVATVAVDSTSTVATLTPQAPLQEGTEYEARLTTTVADTAGNPLASDHVWTFTTVYPVGVPAEVLPAATALLPNAPNPFNPTTTVSFDLARDQQVAVRIYAVDGRLVRTLAAGHLAAGRYTELWNGTDDGGRSVATGVYLLRLESADLVQTRKMSLVK